MHNQAFTRTVRAGPTDSAYSDPVTRMAPSQEEAIDGWFSSRRRSSSQVVPRVESYAFDPYTQAKPYLYSFTRDALEPRIHYTQNRQDGRYVGTVETTATGAPRTFVTGLLWQKHGGADLSFKMMGTNTSLPPVANGYCKMTDVEGKLRWVAVVTRLHGKDILSEQTERLFSLPVFEALATGVAYGLFNDDKKIQLSYPELATQAPPPRGAENAVAERELSGGMKDLVLEAKVPDASQIASTAPDKGESGEHAFTPESVEGFQRAVSVEHSVEAMPLGELYALRRAAGTSAVGTPVRRILVCANPVSYTDHPQVRNMCRFEVDVFADEEAHEDEAPMAVLSVHPVAMKDSAGVLQLQYHVTKPSVGSTWHTPNAEPVEVTTADVEHALTKAAGWDVALAKTIATATQKLAREHQLAMEGVGAAVAVA